MVHINACMVHINACMEHINACIVHISACMVHINACMVHINACMVHINACMVHINACMVHINACMVHVHIIIYHDFLPPPRRFSHVKSDNTTPISPYARHLRLDIQQLRPFFSLSQSHHVSASYPSPGDNHQSTVGQSERTQGQAKMAE